MNKMTWLDLYNFLNERANNVNAFGTFAWNDPVMIFDNATGEMFDCDTYYLQNDNNHDNDFVLMINHTKE